MITHNKNPLFICTAVLMVGVLLFSSSANLLHLIGHKEHSHCKEKNWTHFHQKEANCDVFDFQLTPVLSLENQINTPLAVANFKTIFPPLEDSLFLTETVHYSLRGPPKNA